MNIGRPIKEFELKPEEVGKEKDVPQQVPVEPSPEKTPAVPV